MLGRTLQREFRDMEVIIADRPEADITDILGFEKLIKDVAPDAVIHCAAMTQVDACETDREKAHLLNAIGSGNVACVCKRNHARLIAISTDYVFRGDLDRPYKESDRPDPQTVYGKTKYEGEELIRTYCPNHIILRIAWLYGSGGPSFVHTMLKLADGNHPTLRVVNDQIGNPTGANAVARQIRILLQRPEIVGTLHSTCEGEASWFDFAKEIFKLAGKNQEVIPCTTAEFPRPAPRPANSRLDNCVMRQIGLPAMPDWHDALSEFIRNEKF